MKFVWGLQAAHSGAFRPIRTLDSDTVFPTPSLDFCWERSGSRGPVWGPALRGCETRPAGFRALEDGPQSSPSTICENYFGRARSQQGPNSRFHSRRSGIYSAAPTRKHPTASRLLAAPLPALSAPLVRILDASLAGQPAELWENTYLAQGFKLVPEPRPRLARRPSPRANSPGSFLLAEQRINKQSNNRRNEKLQ